MTSCGKERGGHSDPYGILAAMRTGQSGTRSSRWDEPPAPARYAASKVPLITAYFWIIKLLSTAMGEATSDYMVRTINPVIAVLLGFAGFVIAMVIQFRAKAYNAWIYWLAVVMVAVFGTQAADVLHIKFHVPYVASTTFYAIVLAVIFVALVPDRADRCPSTASAPHGGRLSTGPRCWPRSRWAPRPAT